MQVSFLAKLGPYEMARYVIKEWINEGACTVAGVTVYSNIHKHHSGLVLYWTLL